MSKLETINNIKNIIFGNIKNKIWFKNYNYKKKKFESEFLAILSATWAMIGLGLMSFLIDKLNLLDLLDTINNNFLSVIFSFIVLGLVFGCFSLSIINKIIDIKNKKEINKFIKDAHDMKNEKIINIINKTERFKGSNQLVDFIKSQPLEKEDIEVLNKLLKDNFDQSELNNLFYNENLNNQLKEKGSIDYGYVMDALNLLENNNETNNPAKNYLFKGISPEKNTEIKKHKEYHL